MQPSECNQVNATKWIQQSEFNQVNASKLKATNQIDLNEGMQQRECYQKNASEWMQLIEYNRGNAIKWKHLFLRFLVQPVSECINFWIYICSLAFRM